MTSPFSDKIINCSDCGTDFVFTAGEQEFHAEKGFTTEPRRCKPCRQSRKQSRDGGGYGGGGGGYGDDRGGYGGGGGGGYREREMFTTTCASCGKEAQVPFRPRGDRPVYCNDCFRNQPRDDRRGGGGRDRW